jgi:hypothetical protein
MQSTDAEILALRALTHLARSPDDWDSFMALSGVRPQEVRARAGEPEFLAAVFDFILACDRRARGFCETEGIDPRVLTRARRALPGGNEA